MPVVLQKSKSQILFRTIWTMLSDQIWVVLCWARRWTQWFFCPPSNSGFFMIPYCSKFIITEELYLHIHWHSPHAIPSGTPTSLAFIISWMLLSADYFACLSYRITAALLCLELAVLNIFLIRTEWSVLISCCNKEHSEKRNTLMSNWISRLFFKM